MKSSSVDYDTIPVTLGQIVGNPIAALALICRVGEGNDASVAAFITPAGAAAESSTFRHAIELEASYSDAVRGFDTTQPPYYGAINDVDLDEAARRLGVEQILCLVTLDTAGRVNGVRDYDGLEMTLLEAANTHLTRCMEILEGIYPRSVGRLQ